MAKQEGLIKITGSVDGISFYKSGDTYYARKKSSLSRNRVKTSNAFRNTMRYAVLFAEASRIGSSVYRVLPVKNRRREVYQQLTGMAMKMLVEGMNENELIKELKRSLG